MGYVADFAKILHATLARWITTAYRKNNAFISFIIWNIIYKYYRIGEGVVHKKKNDVVQKTNLFF